MADMATHDALRDAIARDPELSLVRPFLPQGQRDGQIALHALLNEIRQSVFSVSDESIARVKLAWWRDELERLLNGRASHPLTESLARRADWQRLDGEELGELLEGVLMRLEARLYNDDDEMLLHCWRNEGAAAVCSARLAGAAEGATLRAARDLGLARALLHIVLGFEEERQQQRCWIPAERIRMAGGDAAGLITDGIEPDRRAELLEGIAVLAEARHAQALEMAPSGQERKTLRMAALMTALPLRQLQRLRRKDFREGGIGPLARLLAVWRVARREAGISG
ncbi:squalene/phytoene synthase family protein [Natronospira bacteriovora]|uniref:Squalene/phytoene synthase family protein n=1 Tax=Natronospira bacteriovora TaxID=3069753 RepID=A0ABU0W5A0_9GAMM|nr:squalene/phytoene synthase family protein [Natronospira sp. AB-CW4]MDQ2069171.1 squalene/phytoene synthase family protein [Natronospira sp. AB-CW4]